MRVAQARQRSLQAPARRGRGGLGMLSRRSMKMRAGMGDYNYWADLYPGDSAPGIAGLLQTPDLSDLLQQCAQDQVQASGGAMTLAQGLAACSPNVTKAYSTTATPSITDSLANTVYGLGINLPGSDASGSGAIGNTLSSITGISSGWLWAFAGIAALVFVVKR